MYVPITSICTLYKIDVKTIKIDMKYCTNVNVPTPVYGLGIADSADVLPLQVLQ